MDMTNKDQMTTLWSTGGDQMEMRRWSSLIRWYIIGDTEGHALHGHGYGHKCTDTGKGSRKMG